MTDGLKKDRSVTVTESDSVLRQPQLAHSHDLQCRQSNITPSRGTPTHFNSTHCVLWFCRSAGTADPLSAEELQLMDRYFRACNYLTVGQIYLRENPLLREPLKVEHIKPRLLGHFGTSPGLNLLYVHLNRLIQRTNSDVIMMVGPGHGGPAIVANVYLEGTWAEIYPQKGLTPDLAGLRKLFRQFSAPGGIPSHCSPDVPGSIHEGGELGYVLTHAFGAVMDK
jgi:xylulose-5-phosphate/fructose-6-phosphate phosphoketolase